MTEETKVCSKCGLEKPLDDFYKAKNKGYDYHRGDCKTCCNMMRIKKYPEFSIKRNGNRKEKYKTDESVKIKMDNYRKTHKEKSLWMDCKKRAKKKGIPFDIVEADIVIPDVCPVLGIKICKDNDERQYNSPSVDRIIPEKGYVKGNVRVISWRANMVKNVGSADEHRKIAEYIEVCDTRKLPVDNEDYSI